MNTQATFPELTIKALILGILLSVILAGANAYLGLFAGMTVSASIPAAVISMGILKLFRDSNILENNMVQTAASAGESIAAGVIFTMPALIIMGFWKDFDYWWVSMIAGLGGLLGVMFSIPLRRSLIIEEKLQFPEGVATAEVLQVGEQGGKGLKDLAIAGLIGAVVKFCETGLRLWSATIESAHFIGNGLAYIGSNLSPALISVGYIVGLNIAVLIFIGGAISWFIAIPLYLVLGGAETPAISQMIASGAHAGDVAGYVWTKQIRYLGVGAMLTGGIWALISMWPSITNGIRSSLDNYRQAPGTRNNISHTEMDMPFKLVMLLTAGFVIPIFFLYHNITGSVSVSLPMTMIMVIAGFLFSAVAAYMAGLVGSSNNPISGVTIATILLSSLLLVLLMGEDSQVGPAAAIMIGAVVCSAAAISGDNMQDLKAGHILGATPWKQQVMQIIGTVSAVLVMAPILSLLLNAYGFGAPTESHPNALTAPQATLMASVTQGVFGDGLPWKMIAAGCLLGIAIIATDVNLARRGSSWRTPVLAVAVGLYLPLELSVPIFAGGLIAHFSTIALKKAGVSDLAGAQRKGMLIAAGLITGEALVGIFLAIPIVLTGDKDVLAVTDSPWGGMPGLVIMVIIIAYLYRKITR